ncbi:cobyrinic acid a,c-diamide synthase [Peptoclostridium litorale DSM 5388]|uniref:Cobyrinate a,c-diamide synthase n=1 Tax=Peptoclostridium litorale DSM 5388 TaxID=1121324 RepID=A0A069RK48_PEPLI|nr:cobyrinate a,c-diamide synthase [Peptoclostridium litorale]KDR96510.1 cobyrinic acid A,C-diamide synthase CobB [Peptoclostridium litorale DSM 5388]SIN69752.1 cobyrinic acid a,c-diamide synthase [Peptoclostridium litorale DSM 5388]
MDRIMIAGATSGCGKTTVSIGIMAAMASVGKKVAPFKVGPDYIDPQFHGFVTGRESTNLDSFLLDENSVMQMLFEGSQGSDISVIEGVMGLYDGLGVKSCIGSSAHVSKIAKCPVVLVLDGKGVSASIAAQVMGYAGFDPGVDVRGVIINRVSGERHYSILKEAIECHTGVKCLGYLPKTEEVALGSRHLGLIPAGEVKELSEKIDRLSQLVKSHIDIEGLIKIANGACTLDQPSDPAKDLLDYAKGLRLGVAMDKGFNFYYGANIRLFRKMGFEIEYFSPISDKSLPNDIDGLYIGGGFPEVFAKEIEKNSEMRSRMRKSLESGMFAYAECGGLMYLTEKVTGLDGSESEMVGFFPAKAAMTRRLQRFGYVEFECEGITGRTRAHEFHRSYVELKEDIVTAYNVFKKRESGEGDSWSCGFCKKNVMAGYAHVHFYSNMDFARMIADRIMGSRI